MSKLAPCLAMAAALAGAPVLAQPYGDPYWGGSYRYNAPPPPYGYDGGYAGRPLPRDEIVDILERNGFEDIRRIRLEGPVYTAVASSPSGARVRLEVDAYRGHILRQGALGANRYGTLDDEDFGRSPGFDRRYPYAPPREMPGAAPYLDRPGETPSPGRQAARPAEPPPAVVAPAPVAPTEPRALGTPADPRLMPGSETAPTAPARREVSRPSPGGSSGGVYGVNPGSGPRSTTPDAKPQRAPRPAAPSGGDASRPSNDAPRPNTVPRIGATPAPTGGAPAVASEAPADRKPVRVIQGVTPMNNGEQSTPAPQNGVQNQR